MVILRPLKFLFKKDIASTEVPSSKSFKHGDLLVKDFSNPVDLSIINQVLQDEGFVLFNDVEVASEIIGKGIP